MTQLNVLNWIQYIFRTHLITEDVMGNSTTRWKFKVTEKWWEEGRRRKRLEEKEREREKGSN